MAENMMAFAAFTVVYSRGGYVLEHAGKASVEISLESLGLENAGFILYRVDGENRTEIVYSLEEGVLSFETEGLGIFVLCRE